MRVAVVGAGIAGLTAAHRLTQDGHVVDVYERWPGLGGMAATLDVGGGHRLERYYHHLFTSDRHIADLWAELGMPDEIELARVLDGLLRPRPPVAVHDARRPAALPPAVAARARAHGRRCGRAAALQPRSRPATSRSPRATGSSRAWDARCGTRCGARCCEASSATAPTRSRWCGCGASGCCAARSRAPTHASEKLGYPRGSWETLLAALAAAVERGGGRVLIDRPAARLSRDAGGRFLVTPAAPDSFRRGLDPRAFEPLGGEPERYDAVDRDRRLRPVPVALRRPAARRPRRRLPAPLRVDRAITARSACCSSSTASSRPSTGPTCSTSAAPSSA